MSTEEKRDIPTLCVDGVADIHYEKPEDFDKSIHGTVYEKACNITVEIIKEAGYTKDKSGHESSTKLRNREQICNIVFFTGEKGSGKTSTMLSYMEFLKDYHRIKDSNIKCLKGLREALDDFMFTGIEYIDASALDDKEDILGSVLSKMLSKWKNEEERGRYQDSGIVKGSDYDYKKRQMYLQCAEIFERLKELKSTKNVMDSDSDMFIESIESLSFSWNVKNSFQKLVEKYLDVMVYPGSEKVIGKNNHYLVIPIDDIDMNIKSGFMLLEQIRKYLMVPNVLILLSANYEQLENICYHHYWTEFHKFERTPENEKYLRRISREYLEKMVPVQRQVELQSNRQWEYFSNKLLRISYRGKDELNEEGTLCDIVTKYMNRYFGVRFGPDQKCIYYLAPDTVREISSWVCQMSTLKECYENNQCSDLQAYESNLHRFMLSEFPRLCKKYLEKSERRTIEMLEILDPVGQIKLIKDILGKKTKEEKRNSLLKLLAYAKVGYQDVQNFAMLSIIYFSMKLQKLVVQMKWEEDAGKRRISAESLIKYYSIGDWGVWGTWERDMSALMAKLDMNQAVKGWCRIARNSFNSDNDCLSLELEGTLNIADQNSVKEYIEKNKEKLINYQYLLLFYKLGEEDEGQALWQRFTGAKLELAGKRKGVFSLSGFVLNLIEEASLLNKFQNMMSKMLFDPRVWTKAEKEEQCKMFFITPREDLMLPLQNIDFIIYMGTELQKKFGKVENKTLNEKNIKDQVREYFKKIAACLDEYDVVMARKFRKYKLVDKISRQDEFLKMLAKSIEAHVEMELESSLPIDRDWTGEEANG